MSSQDDDDRPGSASDNLQPNIIAAAVICCLIYTSAVAARFYTRIVIVRAKIVAEDWFALIALVRKHVNAETIFWQDQRSRLVMLTKPGVISYLHMEPPQAPWHVSSPLIHPLWDDE